METSTIILLVVLAIIAVAIVWLIVYVYKLEKPLPGNCDYLKSSKPDIKWSSDCSYIQELLSDSSLTTPTEPLFLTRFTPSPSLGEPWGVNVWYKYKYVNSKTGGYSAASPWTKTPISAGSTNLPCQGGNCSNVQYTGKDSCKSNLPQLSLTSLAYPVGSDNYINVHRYVSSLNSTSAPADSVDGKIVGTIIPNGTGGGTFIDTSASPCKEVSCSNVAGC